MKLSNSTQALKYRYIMNNICTYKEFLSKNENIELLDNGLTFEIKEDWIIKGENRLSYVSIMKLVEYCREYHWEKDFLSIDNSLDSITKEIHTYFYKPLLCGKSATILYKIHSFNTYSYIIDFQIYSLEIKTSEIKMECVFYDSEMCKVKKVDNLIIQKVKDKLHYGQEHSN